MTETIDVTTLRKHFPALNKEQVYFDNAGGSQVIQEVIDRFVKWQLEKETLLSI